MLYKALINKSEQVCIL